MCDVMSSSGVVGVCGTWCAAWDGFFVPCPLFLLCTNGVVQYRNHVVYNSQGPEGCAVNRCNG